MLDYIYICQKRLNSVLLLISPKEYSEILSNSAVLHNYKYRCFPME